MLLREEVETQAHEMLSRLLEMEPDMQARVLQKLGPEVAGVVSALLKYDDGLTLLPHQVPPDGDWRWYVMLCGRGAGKTHAGTRWLIREAKKAEEKWLTVVSPTRESFRKITLEGPSGIMEQSPPWFRPKWSPTDLTLTWPNGVVARCYSAEKPDRLRGEQHARVLVEELAAWPKPESFSHVDIGLRLGPSPKGFVSTTPQPKPFILDLVLGPKNAEGKREPREDVVVRTASSEANIFITPKVHKTLRGKYGASRFGRQEMDAELLEKTGLEPFREEDFDRYRVETVPRLRRVAVAVDPTRATSPRDEAGIVAGAVGDDGHGYLLEDCSGLYSPLGWASKAVGRANFYSTPEIVYEENRHKKVVADTLKVLRPQGVKWIPVKATEGKALRAEPIAALNEQGKIHLVGRFPMLEDECCNWSPSQTDWSPGRLDAFVWLFSYLMLDIKPALVAR